ncbi:MAG: GNAT family N-acetyltransferase [Solirubrobacteraceae bacterium]
MRTPSIDVYVAAFVARCDVVRRPGQTELDEPGVRGLLAFADDPLTRLLVTDDRAYPMLAALLLDTRAGIINVSATATRCTKLIDGHPAWKSSAGTAMICRDLDTVPAVSLPSELTLRPVRRLADDAPDGVALEQAAAAARLGDPRIDGPPDAFADYLRSLSPANQLFAAVDGDGAVRATSGCGAFGLDANVFFINTAPGWRGRGIGQAMTAAALRAAQDSGAQRACLDATDAGLPIYRRLGFEAVDRITRWAAVRRKDR